VLSGLAPALAASRANLNDLLRNAGTRIAGASSRGRYALIVTEVALSVVLLTASLLLVRSYLRLAAVDTGFAPATLSFRINPPEQNAKFYEAMLQKLQTLPGVRYAGASSSLPLSHNESVASVEIRGYGMSKEMVEMPSITPDYRKALGMALLRGRDFEARDSASKQQVALVNKAFAALYFAGRDPVGGQVRAGIGNLSKEPWATVVGVVGDVKHSTLEEAGQPQLFRPASHGHDFAVSLDVALSRGVEEARDALHSLDSSLALDNVRTMRERMQESKRAPDVSDDAADGLWGGGSDPGAGWALRGDVLCSEAAHHGDRSPDGLGSLTSAGAMDGALAGTAAHEHGSADRVRRCVCGHQTDPLMALWRHGNGPADLRHRGYFHAHGGRAGLLHSFLERHADRTGASAAGGVGVQSSRIATMGSMREMTGSVGVSPYSRLERYCTSEEVKARLRKAIRWILRDGGVDDGLLEVNQPPPPPAESASRGDPVHD
jgi:hypothetical protein